jgi:hypothetical protein
VSTVLDIKRLASSVSVGLVECKIRENTIVFDIYQESCGYDKGTWLLALTMGDVTTMPWKAPDVKIPTRLVISVKIIAIMVWCEGQ